MFLVQSLSDNVDAPSTSTEHPTVMDWGTYTPSMLKRPYLAHYKIRKTKVGNYFILFGI